MFKGSGGLPLSSKCLSLTSMAPTIGLTPTQMAPPIMTATIHLPELLLLPELFWLAELLPELLLVFSFSESLTVLSPELPKFTVISQGNTPVQYH